MKLLRNVLVLVAAFPPAHLAGGPIRTIEALVADVPDGYEVAVLTSDRDLGAPTRLDVPNNSWQKMGKTDVWYSSVDSMSLYFEGLAAARKRRPEVLYLNSFFSFQFSILPRLLAAVGFFGSAKILLAPRGEFSPGALAIKSSKKRFFIGMYRALRLNRRVIWHASSKLEANDIAAHFGDVARILIHEDETKLPAHARVPEPAAEALRCVFYSRLSPKKGLDILCEALVGLPQTSSQVVVDIYGPEEDHEYVEKSKKTISGASQQVSVTFRGPIAHHLALDTLAQYDFMLFPTHGENFGHVIAEALAASLPVVCTDTTPWTPVLSHGGGIVVNQNSPEEWVNVITQLAGLAPREKDRMKVDASLAYDEWMSSRDSTHVFDRFNELLSQTEH